MGDDLKSRHRFHTHPPLTFQFPKTILFKYNRAKSVHADGRR